MDIGWLFHGGYKPASSFERPNPAKCASCWAWQLSSYHRSYGREEFAILSSISNCESTASTAGVVKGRELRLRCAAWRSSYGRHGVFFWEKLGLATNRLGNIQSSALCILIWLEGSVKRLAKLAHTTQTRQSLLISWKSATLRTSCLNFLLLALGHPQTSYWGDLDWDTKQGRLMSSITLHWMRTFVNY